MFAALASGTVDQSILKEKKNPLLDLKPKTPPPQEPEEETSLLGDDEDEEMGSSVGLVHQEIEVLVIPHNTGNPGQQPKQIGASGRGRTPSRPQRPSLLDSIAPSLFKRQARARFTFGPPHKTPLQLAANGGHLKVMELLVKRGAVWGTRDDWGWTVLHEVAASATRETVAWVCRESKGLNNLPDKLGRGPLLVGLMAGAELGAVEEMIEYGENPAQEDEVGRGCPEAAVLYCSADVVRFLLTHLNTLTGDKKVEVSKELLLEIAEDHEEADLVAQMINELVK